VDSRALPAGLIPALKEATRAAVLAAGGVKRVCEITRLSAPYLSKCQGDAYPDLLPPWAMALVEFHAQAPVFANAFASLTSHRVMPIAEGGGDDSGGHIADLAAVAMAAAAVTATMAENAADGVVTAREAKGEMRQIGALERVMDRRKRRLAVVVGGGA